MSRKGVHNSNLLAGQSIFLMNSKAKIDMSLHIQRVFLSNKEAKFTKLWVLRAKLKVSAVPHLTCEPYVVHAWPRLFLFISSIVMEKEFVLTYAKVRSNKYVEPL